MEGHPCKVHRSCWRVECWWTSGNGWARGRVWRISRFSHYAWLFLVILISHHSMRAICSSTFTGPDTLNIVSQSTGKQYRPYVWEMPSLRSTELVVHTSHSSCFLVTLHFHLHRPLDYRRALPPSSPDGRPMPYIVYRIRRWSTSTPPPISPSSSSSSH
jgi:hypothetical protein